MHVDVSSLLQSIGLGRLVGDVEARGLEIPALAALDDEELRGLGFASAGERARLRAAALSVEEGHWLEASGAWQTTPDPKAATREVPFANCFGMLFVPVPRFKALFSIIPVRRCDFEPFCEQKLRPMPQCRFEQGADHPIVNVSWKDAVAFCDWMTDLEREQGVIDSTWCYRLPTDLEWSAAVGLPIEAEEMNTPRVRSGNTSGYPWGDGFPPPQGCGNYGPTLSVDTFPETSPVASFPPNALGLYDMGGNVWEWCLDMFDHNDAEGVARGASCFNDTEDYLRSSKREMFERFSKRANLGFRVVLSTILFKKSQKSLAWD
jgi:hypothetical protein